MKPQTTEETIKCWADREDFLYKVLKRIADTPEDHALNLRLVARIAIERDYPQFLVNWRPR